MSRIDVLTVTLNILAVQVVVRSGNLLDCQTVRPSVTQPVGQTGPPLTHATFKFEITFFEPRHGANQTTICHLSRWTFHVEVRGDLLHEMQISEKKNFSLKTQRNETLLLQFRGIWWFFFNWRFWWFFCYLAILVIFFCFVVILAFFLIRWFRWVFYYSVILVSFLLFNDFSEFFCYLVILVSFL